MENECHLALYVMLLLHKLILHPSYCNKSKLYKNYRSNYVDDVKVKSSILIAMPRTIIQPAAVDPSTHLLPRLLGFIIIPDLYIL